MTLRTEYDAWHERVHESNRQHEDASSPWYQLVREKIGSVAGLRVLEVACGRGGFVRELACGGVNVTDCDFSSRVRKTSRDSWRLFCSAAGCPRRAARCWNWAAGRDA